MKVDSITKVFTFTREEMAALCAFSSEDEMRAHVWGIALYDDRHAAVSTDGHRLAVLTAHTSDDYAEATGDGYLLPLDKAKQAVKSSKRGDWIEVNEAAHAIRVVRPVIPTKLTADDEDVETVDVCTIPWAAPTSGHPDGDKVRPPPYAEAMPTFDKRGVATILHAAYLADMKRVVAAVMSTADGAERGVVMWPGPKHDSPVGFSIARWTCLIMPMAWHGEPRVALPAKANRRPQAPVVTETAVSPAAE